MSTLAQFRSTISAVIGTDSTAAGTEEGLIDKWVNDAVLNFLLQTHCNVNKGTVTLTAGQNDYDIGSAIMAIQDVAYQAAAATGPSRFSRTTPENINRMREATGSVASVVSYYALNGNSMMMLFPTPTAADVVTFYYVPRPTSMTSGSHDPSNETYGGIPAEYHEALEFYAMWKAADYDDDASSKMGMVYRQYYDDKVKEFKRDIRRKGGRSLGRAFVGRRGVRPGNRSQDLGAW
jgi:hypothetical protein